MARAFRVDGHRGCAYDNYLYIDLAERGDYMKFKLWCVAHGYTARKIEELTGIGRKNIFAWWQELRKPTRANEAILKEKLGIPSGLFDY